MCMYPTKIPVRGEKEGTALFILTPQVRGHLSWLLHHVCTAHAHRLLAPTFGHITIQLFPAVDRLFHSRGCTRQSSSRWIGSIESTRVEQSKAKQSKHQKANFPLLGLLTFQAKDSAVPISSTWESAGDVKKEKQSRKRSVHRRPSCRQKKKRESSEDGGGSREWPTARRGRPKAWKGVPRGPAVSSRSFGYCAYLCALSVVLKRLHLLQSLLRRLVVGQLLHLFSELGDHRLLLLAQVQVLGM